MKFPVFLLFIFLTFNAANAAVVDNSIVPLMEKFELVGNLNAIKFSNNQFIEIAEALAHKGERIRVVTYNMLRDDLDQKREEVNRWPQRLPRIVELLNDMRPDVIGAQELSQKQVDDLKPFLGTAFSFYGEKRADGELNGIFFRKDRFSISKGEMWHMASNTVTMLQLQDMRTGRLFAIFNTHMSFKANEREQEIFYIKKQMSKVAAHMPVILTGDLNIFPARLDIEKLPYYDGDYAHRLITKNGFLADSGDVALLGHLGPISTFTNGPLDAIPFRGTGTPGIVLDHIYVSEGITVLVSAVQPATVEGHYPSDHMPVMIDFIFNNQKAFH